MSGPVIGSLAELAGMPGMPSEPTLRNLIRDNDDFPVLSRGKSGLAYEFDLEAAFAFVRGLQEREQQKEKARREQLAQLSMTLLGEDALAHEDEVRTLSPSEQGAMLNAEYLRIKIAEKRGALIPASEVEAGIAEDFVWIHDGGRAFSSRCAKRAVFTREQLAVIDEVMDEWLTQLADRMERRRDDVGLSSETDGTATAVPQLQ